MTNANKHTGHLAQLVVIDQSKMVSMSNHSIESRILEHYGIYGMKLVMIGVVGAYAFEGKSYDPTVFIKFSVENFAKLIGKEEKYATTIFKKTCTLLRSKEVTIPGYIDDKEAEFVTGILDTYGYSYDEKTLAIKFNPAFIPHFMEMTGNFTQHELGYVLSLDRMDSISFYRFLKMKIGKEFRKVIEEKEYYVDIEEAILRKFFNVEDKYTRQRDLKSKILDKVAVEISSKTDLIIHFDVSQKANIFTLTFKIKGEQQKPNRISISDFKLAKQKNVKPSRKKMKTVSELDAVKIKESKDEPGEYIPAQAKNKKDTPVSNFFSQRQTPKAKLPPEQLEEFANQFIKQHQKEYDLIAELIGKGTLTFKKTANELIYYLISTYQSRYGSEGLADYVINELAEKIEIFYRENCQRSEAVSLSALGVFFV